jgi:hypothetical protein
MNDYECTAQLGTHHLGKVFAFQHIVMYFADSF